MPSLLIELPTMVVRITSMVLVQMRSMQDSIGTMVMLIIIVMVTREASLTSLELS
jgi:hypothetical protein